MKVYIVTIEETWPYEGGTKDIDSVWLREDKAEVRVAEIEKTKHTRCSKRDVQYQEIEVH